MSNSIFSITTYRHAGGWAFTDRERDLVHEAFVAGADTLIEGLANGADQVHLRFSHIQFPGSQLTLMYDSGAVEVGTNYHCLELEHPLWLCPALGKYYPEASPLTLYVQFKSENQ